MLCFVAGETYLILDRPLRAVVEHLHERVEQNTQLGWPVSKIEYSSAGARLYGSSGENASSAGLFEPVHLKLKVLTVCMLLRYDFFPGALPRPPTSNAALCACRQCCGVSPCDRDSSHSDAAAGEDTVLSSPAGRQKGSHLQGQDVQRNEGNLIVQASAGLMRVSVCTPIVMQIGSHNSKARCLLQLLIASKYPI